MLPVGRRFAFDPLTGRIWVLCTSCRNWNLAPIEERWEAVADAERLFERASITASTANVSLGRVMEGTELVRIGKVAKPEIAAWRYGDRLSKRWRRFRKQIWFGTDAGVALAGGAFLGAAAILPVFAGMLGLRVLRDIPRWRRPVMVVDDGTVIRVKEAGRALLLPGNPEGNWQLEIPRAGAEPVSLTGERARRALRGFLPMINALGGAPEQIDHAIRRLGATPSTDRAVMQIASDLGDVGNMNPAYRRWAQPHRIALADPILQLALEMAVNDEVEARALDGGLRQLEREWREAAELATISDDLLFPSHLAERLRRLKGNRDRDGAG
jgi:hypothetical protein